MTANAAATRAAEAQRQAQLEAQRREAARQQEVQRQQEAQRQQQAQQQQQAAQRQPLPSQDRGQLQPGAASPVAGVGEPVPQTPASAFRGPGDRGETRITVSRNQAPAVTPATPVTTLPPPNDVLGALDNASRPVANHSTETVGTLVQDPASSADRLTRTQTQAAQAAVAQAQPFEQTALSTLPLRAQQDYANVRALTQGDPTATAGLQSLLLRGQLTGGRDFRNENDVLGHLAGIAAPGRTFAEGVTARTVTTSLVRELASPESISQGPRGTCVPTSMLTDVARRNPAEYARLASGLSTPAGTVQLAGGAFLSRSEGTASPDNTGRSAIQRLMGPALMEVANEDRIYHDGFSSQDADAPRGPDGKPLDDGAGAYDPGAWIAMRQLYGNNAPMDFVEATDTSDNKDAMMQMVGSVRSDRAVFASLSLDRGNHEVLILPNQGEGNPAQGNQQRIRIQNPWGQTEELSAEDFRNRVRFVSSVDVPPAERNVPTTPPPEESVPWRRWMGPI